MAWVVRASGRPPGGARAARPGPSASALRATGSAYAVFAGRPGLATRLATGLATGLARAAGLVILASAALLLRASAGAEPLVVIDPGHGGEETGARSASGAEEKTLALAIARSARAHLQKAGVRVRLTRVDDRALSLGARPSLANRLDADAFVSIHLNHAPDPARRGWETYVLSAEASDELTARLLAQEEGSAGTTQRGASRPGEGPSGQGPPGARAGGPAFAGVNDLDLILGDLSRAVAHERSARLAKAIQDAIEAEPSLGPSRGLRQAPFAVLVGAAVPAVLVEVGYLSNEAQAAFLSSDRGQRAAGRAIARGILTFLRTSAT